MDRDLCYYSTRVVEERFDGDLASSAERIVDLVDQDFIRYFATIEQVPELDRSDLWGCDANGGSITGDLVRVSEARGIHHIGHYQLDPTSWHSTGPMHRFRDYHDADPAELRDHPTAAVRRLASSHQARGAIRVRRRVRPTRWRA